MEARIVKNPITVSELKEVADNQFGDLVKAVVDIAQEIIALGGELHSDEEVLLVEEAGSRREDTWGINIFPEKSQDEWIEFDSMINLKPHFGNRSRDVENQETREKIRSIVGKLITD